MTDDELHILLSQPVWTIDDRMKLVELWNERRGDSIGKIGLNNVRTSCRLKSIVGAFRHFLESDK